MTHNIVCYRCGGSLALLSLPLSRRDECPHCQNYLHVCRMCTYYDPLVVRQCREDDAEDVKEKERLNFCDYFSPAENAFDPVGKLAADKAARELGNLFGEGSAEAGGDTATGADDAICDADKLFR